MRSVIQNCFDSWLQISKTQLWAFSIYPKIPENSRNFVGKLWRYMYDKIQFTEMAIQLVESDIQQVKFDKKKATKGEKH